MTNYTERTSEKLIQYYMISSVQFNYYMIQVEHFRHWKVFQPISSSPRYTYTVEGVGEEDKTRQQQVFPF